MEANSSGSGFKWIISTSEVKPGNSAILGGNVAAFYTIHYTAIGVICMSMVSCFIVIIHIASTLFVTRRQISSYKDLSLRFPFYLAIADFMWSFSHLIDHVVLVIQQKFSNDGSVVIFSLSLWFCFG